MPSRIKYESLNRLFANLIERSFADLQVRDPDLKHYVTDLLVRFARSDALYHVADPGATKVDTVVEMLIEAEELKWNKHSSFQTLRHTGDYALFMTGIFRNYVERGGYLEWYMTEGPRSYRRAMGAAPKEADREVLERLWRDFEQVSGALDQMWKVYFGRVAVQEGLGGLVRRFETWN